MLKSICIGLGVGGAIATAFTHNHTAMWFAIAYIFAVLNWERLSNRNLIYRSLERWQIMMIGKNFWIGMSGAMLIFAGAVVRASWEWIPLLAIGGGLIGIVAARADKWSELDHDYHSYVDIQSKEKGN
jgi:hypothetical protein